MAALRILNGNIPGLGTLSAWTDNQDSTESDFADASALPLLVGHPAGFVVLC